MGEIPLNLNPSEPLALVKKLPRFDDLIELDMLMEIDLHLGLHDLVQIHQLNEIRVEFCMAKCLATDVQERWKFG